MDAAMRFGSIFAQPFQIKAIVLIGKGTSLPIIATLNDVQRNAGKIEAGAAGHGGWKTEGTSLSG